MDSRRLAPGQRTEIWIADIDGGPPALLFATSALLLEAPNWSVDGEDLFLNGDGRLWRLDANAPSAPEEVAFERLPPLNNDHLLSRDGRWVFMSAVDGHIYRGARTGGSVERVSPDDGKWHFLHGLTADASRLAYVELAGFEEPGRLVVSPGHGLPGAVIDTGPGHIDGPEWSPDDSWIYFNTEGFTTAPGHAQLARIPDGGGAVERLVSSATVDWFPHLSPDGRFATYLSFLAGTRGHPADLNVSVKLVRTADWATTVSAHPLFGGQGTLNVNSWHPDSRRFAYAAYPFDHSSSPDTREDR